MRKIKGYIQNSIVLEPEGIQALTKLLGSGVVDAKSKDLSFLDDLLWVVYDNKHKEVLTKTRGQEWEKLSPLAFKTKYIDDFVAIDSKCMTILTQPEEMEIIVNYMDLFSGVETTSYEYIIKNMTDRENLVNDIQFCMRTLGIEWASFSYFSKEDNGFADYRYDFLYRDRRDIGFWTNLTEDMQIVNLIQFTEICESVLDQC